MNNKDKIKFRISQFDHTFFTCFSLQIRKFFRFFYFLFEEKKSKNLKDKKIKKLKNSIDLNLKKITKIYKHGRTSDIGHDQRMNPIPKDKATGGRGSATWSSWSAGYPLSSVSFSKHIQGSSGCLQDITLKLFLIQGAAPYVIAIAAPGIAGLLELTSPPEKVPNEKAGS